MVTKMNERLQQFLAAENLTQAQFAESINVAPAGVSHILAGRNKPGYDFIYNMLRRYPDLNIEWLLTGKGKMYKSLATLAAQTAAAQVQTPQPSPVPAARPDSGQERIPLKNDDEGLNIFDDIPEISVDSPAADEKIAATTAFKASEDAPQKAVKQRKATKIIVFYDDNTFQEF